MPPPHAIHEAISLLYRYLVAPAFVLAGAAFLAYQGWLLAAAWRRGGFGGPR